MGASKIKTAAEKEMVLSEIARLDRRCYTQQMIRDDLARRGILSVSVPMICNYLKEIRRRYATSTIENRDAVVREKVEQIREVIRTAWEAYDRSCLDGVRKVTERAVRRGKDDEQPPPSKPVSAAQLKKGRGVLSSKTGKMMSARQEVEETLQRIKVIVTREGRVPANEFLQTIIRSVELECRLLGLLDREKDQAGANQLVVTVDWASMLSPSAVSDHDVLAAKLASLPPADQLPIVTPAAPTPSTNGDH